MASIALRQFGALLRKNATLALRSRRSLLGLGGAASLLLQVLLPAAFFCLMWIPKHYIPTIHHPAFLEARAYGLDTRWWAGPSPYEGARFLPQAGHDALPAGVVYVCTLAVQHAFSYRSPPSR
jgi:hypothetical protein